MSQGDRSFDLERRTIRVCQSITYQRQIKTPKTQAGIRTLAIDATTASHLATWKGRQSAELANGADVKTVQTRLGHASASITLGWYAHAIPEKGHEAADLPEAILSGVRPQDSAVEEGEKSPKCPLIRNPRECPLDAHGPEKRKQASRLKKS